MPLYLQIAAVLLASVLAEPEADPKAWYASYGYPYAGLTYAGAYAGFPATYGYGLGYGYNGYALGAHYIGKRSADSEPEAKANPEGPAPITTISNIVLFFIFFFKVIFLN